MTDNETSGGVLADFLSEPELADEIGVTVRTLRRWAAMREGPPRTHVGKRIAYRKDSVKAWLASCEREPA